jgi:hypothetical protein
MHRGHVLNTVIRRWSPSRIKRTPHCHICTLTVHHENVTILTDVNKCSHGFQTSTSPHRTTCSKNNIHRSQRTQLSCTHIRPTTATILFSSHHLLYCCTS